MYHLDYWIIRDFLDLCLPNLSPCLQKNAELDDSAQDGGHGTPHPSDVLDMPVDPNEPTYCLCHQVSYGEMIGCDNPDVRSKMIGIIPTITFFTLFP